MVNETPNADLDLDHETLEALYEANADNVRTFIHQGISIMSSTIALHGPTGGSELAYQKKIYFLYNEETEVWRIRWVMPVFDHFAETLDRKTVENFAKRVVAKAAATFENVVGDWDFGLLESDHEDGKQVSFFVSSNEIQPDGDVDVAIKLLMAGIYVAKNQKPIQRYS